MRRYRQLSITAVVAIIFQAFIVSVVFAGEFGIAIGDSMEKVESVLGKPKGRMTISPKDIVLAYPNGTVDFHDGKVSYIKLRDSAEMRQMARWAREQREARARQAAELARQQEQKRQQRLAAGRKELEVTLNDETFSKRSAIKQMEYWDDFKKRYPEISVSQYTDPLRPKVAEERKKRREVEREALAAKIKLTEKEVDELANKSGLSRRGLIHARRDLANKRKQLELLKKQYGLY